jgi:hypothetical protein
VESALAIIAVGGRTFSHSTCVVEAHSESGVVAPTAPFKAAAATKSRQDVEPLSQLTDWKLCFDTLFPCRINPLLRTPITLRAHFPGPNRGRRPIRYQ